MTQIDVMCDGDDMFVVRNGTQIARREGGAWIPLIPGFSVTDDGVELTINYTPPRSLDREESAGA